MRYYPFYIDMRDQTVLLIGGGKVGFRKARELLRSECRIVAVSKTFLEEFDRLDSERLLRHRLSVREFFARHRDILDRVNYAVVAMNDPKETQWVTDELRRRKVAVLRADKGEESDFIMPSIVEKKEVSVAIRAGGAGPLISKEIRDRIRSLLDDLDMEKIELLSNIRRKLIKIPFEDREFVLQEVIEDLLHSKIETVRDYWESLGDDDSENQGRNERESSGSHTDTVVDSKTEGKKS